MNVGYCKYSQVRDKHVCYLPERFVKINASLFHTVMVVSNFFMFVVYLEVFVEIDVSLFLTSSNDGNLDSCIGFLRLLSVLCNSVCSLITGFY